MFTLAHLSDPHLPLPKPRWTDLLNKRVTGFLSWTLRRKKIYRPEIRTALVKDMLAQRPDHIALTGDLMNIALPEEIGPALRFVQELGAPEHVSLVPGNHDSYAKSGPGLTPWADYMEQGTFPYVKLKNNIALIGLISAVPTPPLFATGRLGENQLNKLKEILSRLRKQQICRVILIHHPPFGEKTFPRKALTDAPALRRIIAEEGAELILHGHMHMTAINEVPVPGGTCPVIGVAAASALPHGEKDPAAYHLYHIERIDEAWQIEVDIRKLDLTEAGAHFPSAGRLRFVLPRVETANEMAT